MDEIVVKTFAELHECTQSMDSRYAIYRGVTNIDYELIPTVGRISIRKKENLNDVEKFMLKTFKERAVPYLEFQPKNEWEWLAIAQHHGLPTRLLDWTRNVLVAAYFAVRRKYEGDSGIYALQSEMVMGGPEKWDNPLNLGGVETRYIPGHVTQRIVAQNGLFTVHPDPTKSLSYGNVLRIRIPLSYRGTLKRELYKYGIHEASMFPGLDGLSKHISWMNQSCY